MHEMSVATSLVQEILTHLDMVEGHEVLGVDEVQLEIGELAFINKRQLEFCFDVVKREHGQLKEARLTMTEERALVRCHGCGFSGGLEAIEEPVDHRMVMSFACPKCGGTLDIERGRGMLLRNIGLRVEE